MKHVTLCNHFGSVIVSMKFQCGRFKFACWGYGFGRVSNDRLASQGCVHTPRCYVRPMLLASPSTAYFQNVPSGMIGKLRGPAGLAYDATWAP